jgi:hypothetical protein
MLTDIILSNLPFPRRGKCASVVMHVRDPIDLTWEDIFAFIEKKTKLPRRFLAGSDFKGKYVYGQYQEYPPWIYDNYRLLDRNGKYTMSALVNIHFAPFGGCQLKKKH